MKCPSCHSEIADNSKFCPVCGSKIEAPPAEIICQNCQTVLPADAKFCENCGTSVSQSEALVPAEAAVPTEPVVPAELEAPTEPLVPAAAVVPAEPVMPAGPICPSCQANLIPGTSFCTKCGHRLADAAPAAPQAATYTPPVYQPQAVQQAQPVYQPQVGYPPGPAQPPAPVKKKKGWLVALIIVLVLALAGGAAYFFAGSQIKRLIMGPKKTYLAIEAKALKENADDLLANAIKYGNKKERSPKGGADLELSLDLNSDVLDLDPSLAAILDSLSLKASLQYDNSDLKPSSFMALDFFTGSERLFSLETLVEEDRVVFGLPDILDKYLEAPVADLDDLLYDMDIYVDSDDLLSFGQMAKLDLDINKAEMQKSLYKIIDIVLANIDEVKYEKNVSLALNGVENKYDAYTVSINSSQAEQMMLELLEHLHKDKEIYNLVSNVYQLMDPYSYYVFTYSEYQSTIEDAIKEIKDSKNQEEITFTQTIYVDKNDVIFGRDMKFSDDRNKPIMQFKSLHPVSGNKEAYLVMFEADGDSVELNSSYTVKDDKKTGSASVLSNGKKELAVDFKDIYRKEIGQDEFILGEAELSFTGSLDMPDKLTYSGREESGRFKLDLGMPPFGKISIGYRSIDSRDVTIPRFDSSNLLSVTDIYDFEELVTEDSMEKLMQILQKLGLEDLFYGYDDDYDFD